MEPIARIASITLPRTLVFGAGSVHQCAADVKAQSNKRWAILTSPVTRSLATPLMSALPNAPVIEIPDREPTFVTLEAALTQARTARVDGVIGIGGGSVLDVAKLVAGLLGTSQKLVDVVGSGKLAPRTASLVCLPTTAGTGSEVSPNSILLDESDSMKKAVISPHLMPDASYVDPELTITCPRSVTAGSGLDAMVHAIEAYASKFSHPLMDPFALEAVRLIGRNIVAAYDDGKNLAARSAVALGSMYAGMCLGPVNTGAVHALAYPLGSLHGVAHGLSNALLLPHVLAFNLPAAPGRYAEIAVALGAERQKDDVETAQAGLSIVAELCDRCGIPKCLRDINIKQSDLDPIARSAMTVTRLLERNVRPVTYDDAIGIYTKAF